MGFKCGVYPKLISGGNVSFINGGYKIHTFTESGTFINSSSNIYYADILVVGGGGGSGYDGPTPIVIGNQGGTAGGGAGGSVLKRKWVTLSNNTSFPTIIGSAGNSSNNVNYVGTSLTFGGDTIFNSPGNNGVPELRAPGGASGAESFAWQFGSSVNIDNPLGSGGGGSAAWGTYSQTGPGTGANVIGYGFSGGNNGGTGNGNTGTPGGAGGGGGAGSAGVDGGPGSNNAGGLGGDGLPISDFTGNPLDYAGVGGGGSPVSPPGGSVLNSAPRHPQDINSPTHYGRGGAVGPNSNRQSQDGIVIIKLI